MWQGIVQKTIILFLSIASFFIAGGAVIDYPSGRFPLPGASSTFVHAAQELWSAL